MTIYQQGPLHCSGHRILHNLYLAQGQPRTAQTFLCTGPGGVTVDIINVHAPSGKPSACRVSLLQSKRHAQPSAKRSSTFGRRHAWTQNTRPAQGAHSRFGKRGSWRPTGRVLCSGVWRRLRAGTKEIPCTDYLCLPEQCYRACCQQCHRACCGASCDGAGSRSK